MKWVVLLKEYGLLSVVVTLLGINTIFVINARDDINDNCNHLLRLEDRINDLPKRMLDEWRAMQFMRDMQREGIDRGKMDTIKINR